MHQTAVDSVEAEKGTFAFADIPNTALVGEDGLPKPADRSRHSRWEVDNPSPH